MRKANQLTRQEAVGILQAIQARLYLDTDNQGTEFWNPDKQWDGADVCQDIAGILAQSDLVPPMSEPMAPGEDLAAELVELARQQGLEPEDLDDLVHDALSRQGSATNNEGLEGQIQTLVDLLGAEQARRELDGLAQSP